MFYFMAMVRKFNTFLKFGFNFFGDNSCFDLMFGYL